MRQRDWRFSTGLTLKKKTVRIKKLHHEGKFITSGRAAAAGNTPDGRMPSVVVDLNHARGNAHASNTVVWKTSTAAATMAPAQYLVCRVLRFVSLDGLIVTTATKSKIDDRDASTKGVTSPSTLRNVGWSQSRRARTAYPRKGHAAEAAKNVMTNAPTNHSPGRGGAVGSSSGRAVSC